MVQLEGGVRENQQKEVSSSPNVKIEYCSVIVQVWELAIKPVNEAIEWSIYIHPWVLKI